MHTTLAFYEATTTDRRLRYEAAAARHRLVPHRRFLSRLRRHGVAPAPARDRLALLPASTSLGRTPSGAERQAA